VGVLSRKRDLLDSSKGGGVAVRNSGQEGEGDFCPHLESGSNLGGGLDPSRAWGRVGYLWPSYLQEEGGEKPSITGREGGMIRCGPLSGSSKSLSYVVVEKTSPVDGRKIKSKTEKLLSNQKVRGRGGVGGVEKKEQGLSKWEKETIRRDCFVDRVCCGSAPKRLVRGSLPAGKERCAPISGAGVKNDHPGLVRKISVFARGGGCLERETSILARRG